MENNIKKDYFWNTLGVFLQNALSPLLLIVVTRVNGIYDSGIFSFAFSVAIIFWAVGMWGGRTYQVSDVKKEFSHRSYITLRFLLLIIVFIAAVVFSILNQYDILKTSIILSLVLFKLVESVADAYHGVLQVHGRLYIAGKALTIKALMGLGAFALTDVFTKDLLLSSLMLVLVTIAVTLLYDIRIAKSFEPLFVKASQVSKYVNESLLIMKRCAPVFVVVLFAMFSLNIPRYFIDVYHTEQNGYFGIIAMPVTLVVLLMTFILQPNVLALSQLFNKKKYADFHKTIKKVVGITLGVGIIVVVGTALLGVPVLGFVFDADFSQYGTALLIMVVGGVVNAIVGVLINIFTIMRRFRAQFSILLLTNILLILLSSFIVKTEGLLGGVILFACANVVQVVLFAFVYFYALRKARHAEKN